MATCRPSFFHILFAYSDQQFKSEWILVHFIHRLINNLLTFGLGGSIARNAVAADLKKFSFSACRDGALFLSIQIGSVLIPIFIWPTAYFRKLYVKIRNFEHHLCLKYHIYHCFLSAQKLN